MSGWSLLVTVGAGLLLITLDNSILFTALPTLTEDLQASSTQCLWIINAVSEICEIAGADVVKLADAIGYDDRIGRKFLGASHKRANVLRQATAAEAQARA